MRKTRQNLILKLIDRFTITTQEELLEKLQESGVSVTQATVSRDIKELGLLKRPAANGTYKYSLSQAVPEEKNEKYHAIFTQSAIFADWAGNICLIKCHEGTAQAACAAIDSMNWADIVGTLAGDDTVFVLCRTENAAVATKDAIEKILEKS